MKTFTAPEGKLVTVLVDGVEVSYVPGQEYPDNAEFVVTERLAEQPASFDKRGIEPYRAAIMVNEGGVDEKNSVKGAIVGGTVTGERIDGAVINSTSDDFSAVVSVGGTYSIKNSVLNFDTKSDGKHVCDFSGYGAVLAGFRVQSSRWKTPRSTPSASQSPLCSVTTVPSACSRTATSPFAAASSMTAM